MVANADQVQKEVLYIEDDDSNLALMRHLFIKKLPYLRLLEAKTSKEGIEIAYSRKLSLILVDIHLPDQNGFITLKEIKSYSHHKPTPIWAISAHVFESDIQDGLAAGFQQYITKPYNVKRLAQLINDLLIHI